MCDYYIARSLKYIKFKINYIYSNNIYIMPIVKKETAVNKKGKLRKGFASKVLKSGRTMYFTEKGFKMVDGKAKKNVKAKKETMKKKKRMKKTEEIIKIKLADDILAF